eukprot:TRINITY_DN385_c0_g1_i1.p3 TRINITY_DN385_c0_g1~~TRINITY_DN385_c0_g1_i1.p3  ORF type:complete len:325 (+),score=75.50 TRINITY_DN385_c0_g1_i1:142-1116(+)
MTAQPKASTSLGPIKTEADEENAHSEPALASNKVQLEKDACEAQNSSSAEDAACGNTLETKPSHPDENGVKSNSRKVSFGTVEVVRTASLPAADKRDEESDEEDEDYTLSDADEDEEDEELDDGVDHSLPPEQLASAMAEVSTLLKGRLKSFIDSGTLGSKPLHAAAASNDVSKLRELLKEGSEYHGNVNDVDVFQYNALHVAAERGCVEACKVLVELGIDKNATTRMHQSTALHYAAFEGHDDVIATLLDAGVEIDAVTDDGRTALYQASLRGHTHCVNLLLRNGANRDIKTKGNKIAAEVSSKEEITSLFQQPAPKKSRVET